MKTYVYIITFPSNHGTLAPLTPILNLIRIIHGLNRQVCLISGGRMIDALKLRQISLCTIKLRNYSSFNPLMRIINYILIQAQSVYYLLRAVRRADLFIFISGGETFLLPAFVLKFLRRKILLMPAGIPVKGYFARKDLLFAKFVSILTGITSYFADALIFYSKHMALESDVTKRKCKVIIAHEHIVDFTKFVVKKKINERANVVGYMGRFSEEKGILNLVKAIPLVLKHRKDIRFMLCGEGKLSDEIRNIIRQESLEAYVELTKWVPHENVPDFLNDFKLLVLPSYTEGLPNTMLEAMACGTPVLATPVGPITDIIRNEETGFLLKSNNPKHIAERIVELLNKPDLLERVSINAYNYVRENFSYGKTLEAWQKILEL